MKQDIDKLLSSILTDEEMSTNYDDIRIILQDKLEEEEKNVFSIDMRDLKNGLVISANELGKYNKIKYIYNEFMEFYNNELNVKSV